MASNMTLVAATDELVAADLSGRQALSARKGIDLSVLELRLAWRNVWRNPRRTGLTVAATVSRSSWWSSLSRWPPASTRR